MSNPRTAGKNQRWLSRGKRVGGNGIHIRAQEGRNMRWAGELLSYHSKLKGDEHYQSLASLPPTQKVSTFITECENAECKGLLLR